MLGDRPSKLCLYIFFDGLFSEDLRFFPADKFKFSIEFERNNYFPDEFSLLLSYFEELDNDFSLDSLVLRVLFSS